MTQRSSSAGREKTQDCWKGQLPDDKTLKIHIFSIQNVRQCRSQIKKHLDREVDVQRLPRVGQVPLEVLVQILAHPDVLEHPLQLACVLKPARLWKTIGWVNQSPCSRLTLAICCPWNLPASIWRSLTPQRRRWRSCAAPVWQQCPITVNNTIYKFYCALQYHTCSV